MRKPALVDHLALTAASPDRACLQPSTPSRAAAHWPRFSPARPRAIRQSTGGARRPWSAAAVGNKVADNVNGLGTVLGAAVGAAA